MSIKKRNRAVRQEDYREYLAEKCRLEHVIDNIIKIENLDFDARGPEGDLDYKQLQANKFKMDALKTANDQRLKLVAKYAPDLKAVEMTSEGGGEFVIKLAEFKS